MLGAKRAVLIFLRNHLIYQAKRLEACPSRTKEPLPYRVHFPPQNPTVAIKGSALIIRMERYSSSLTLAKMIYSCGEMVWTSKQRLKSKENFI